MEAMPLVIPRDAEQRDLVLYLPDEIFLHDQAKGLMYKVTYEFSFEGASNNILTCFVCYLCSF